MGTHSQSYQRSSTFYSKPAKPPTPSDLYDLLGIVNLECSSLTCVGFAHTEKRRCRDPMCDFEAIDKMLEDLSDKLANGLHIFDLLVELATVTLCTSWHQGQAEDVARNWENLIDNEYAARYPQVDATHLEKLKQMLRLSEQLGFHDMSQHLRRLILAEENPKKHKAEERRRQAKERQERERKTRAAEEERKRQEEKVKQAKNLKSWEEAWNDYIKGWRLFEGMHHPGKFLLLANTMIRRKVENNPLACRIGSRGGRDGA
jgi:hypothetical protein